MLRLRVTASLCLYVCACSSHEDSAPQLGGLSPVLVDEGDTAIIALSASDEDGDELAFELVDPVPAFARLDGAMLTLAPSFTDAGQHAIGIRVSDGELSTVGELVATVNDVNARPVIQEVAPIELAEGAIRDIVLMLDDADGDAVALALSGTAPSFASLSGTTLRLAPLFDDAASYEIVVAASDGRGGAGSVSIALTVTDVKYGLTVVTMGAGTGSVTSSPAGVDCGADCGEIFEPNTVVTLAATADASSDFIGWGGDCTGIDPCTVTMSADRHVTAAFAPKGSGSNSLTVAKDGSGTGAVTSSPAGIDCGIDCAESYLAGTIVTLAAAPDPTSTFTGWTGGTCAGTGSCTVTMNASHVVTATFALKTYPLTVMRGGNGAGTVTSAPSGIACGADCIESFEHGTVVTLTATAGATSDFVGWGGGGCSGTGDCTVTITEASDITATFALKRHRLTVARAGSGTGMVTSSPTGIDCGTTCTTSFEHSTTIALNAVVDSTSTFVGWSGGGCSGTGTCTVAMTAARNVTATFTARHALVVSKTGNGTGAVTSNPAGISCGADCSETYLENAVVTLTATPSASSTFTGWSGGCTGTASCTVTMSAAQDVTATFALETYVLAVARSGTGNGTVTSSPSGIDCGTTCSASYDHGASVTLTAAPDPSSTFVGWSGGGCTGTSACTVVMTSARSVTATFVPKTYPVTVTRDGSGSGTVTSAGIACGTDCSQTYSHGTVVTLTASPASSSTFAGWAGGGCAGTGTCTVTVTAASDVIATFALKTYALTVVKSGGGDGTITSSPAGIDCGAACSASFDHGTSVTLTVAADASSTFTGWSGVCTGTGTCVVSMTAAQTVTATFVLKTHALTVTRSGAGTGTVTSSPAGIACGADCSDTYDHGTSVTLTAVADGSSDFAGWSGACSGSASTCTVSMIAARSVTAAFAIKTWSLAVTKAGAGTGTVTSSPASINCGTACNQTYSHGTVVTLTATADASSTFSGWSGTCSGTGSCTVTMTAAASVTATFALKQYALSVVRSGNGGGTVTSPESPIREIDCRDPSSDCAGTYTHGATVTLTASPDTSSIVSSWSVAGCSGTTCTVTISTPTTIIVSFARIAARPAIAAGPTHTCLRRPDGSVACWGDNGGGASLPPVDTFLQLSSHDEYTCGVTELEGVRCWGWEPPGPLPSVVRQVSAGYQHACAIRTDGTIGCWGDNNWGQAVAPAGTFIAVSAGWYHTCAVRTDGAVTCWGLGADGQTTPPSGSFLDVSSGGSHACGLRDDRTVVCWGDNASGQATPPSGQFDRIGVGAVHGCGLRDDGSIACWGGNHALQLQAPAGSFTELSVSRNRACARRTDGQLICWGQFHEPIGTFQQIDSGDTYFCGVRADDTAECWGHTRTAAAPSGSFLQISSGVSHACGVTLDGLVTCWGDNTYNQSLAPPLLFDQVTALETGTCGIRQLDSKVTCWGQGSNGSTAPPSGDAFSQISGFSDHVCGVRLDGTIACWGNNLRGQATPPSGQFIQVDAGANHTCGIRTDGTVTCWGDNSRDQLNAPSGTFVKISSGFLISCGVRTDGTAVCWGRSAINFGQYQAPVGTFVDVSCGFLHVCGTRSDGNVSCWGSLLR